MTPGTIIASGYYLTAREQQSLAKQIDAEIAPLVEALAMSVAEMSRARGRLETIAMCNEDRRIAASLGSQCDFIRAAIAKAKQEERT